MSKMCPSKMLFEVMLVVVYQWTMAESLIGSNPGLGFRPMPDTESNVAGTLISFLNDDQSSWKPWFDRMKLFLDDYEPGKQSGHSFMPCTFASELTDDQVCTFDIRDLGNRCTKENNFGYDQGQPCIAIMMNKIVDWVPVTYNMTNVPDEMPEWLKMMVSDTSPDHRMVWLSCEGESSADRENIGPVQFHPQAGFPVYYFPYRNTTHYLSPLVMIQFLRPVPGVLINVECRAWALNIEYNRMERRGSVHFELHID